MNTLAMTERRLTMLDPRLAYQSRSRPLSEAEQALARAMEAIFAAGVHDPAGVADHLQNKGVARPSGTAGPWSAASLADELALLNVSLDAHYARDGLGA
jgi:hypothetical protein